MLVGLKGTDANAACLSSPDGELHLRVESAVRSGHTIWHDGSITDRVYYKPLGAGRDSRAWSTPTGFGFGWD